MYFSGLVYLIVLLFCFSCYTAERSKNEFQNNKRSLLFLDSTTEVDSLKNLEADACYFIFCFFLSWEHFSFATWPNKYAPPNIQHLPILCAAIKAASSFKAVTLKHTLYCLFLGKMWLVLEDNENHTHWNDLCRLCSFYNIAETSLVHMTIASTTCSPWHSGVQHWP